MHEKFNEWPAQRPIPDAGRIQDLWTREVLSVSALGPTYSAVASSRARRPAWVLKPMPWPAESALPDSLRPDALDLLSLRHPALAMPERFAHDRNRGRCFAVRRFVPGLSPVWALEGLPPQELVLWLGWTVEALSILHHHGCLHRNLKATNILVTASTRSRRASGSRVVLCDPWLTREERDVNGRAPDVGSSAQDAFPSSDLYDLGLVFAQLLGGTDAGSHSDAVELPTGSGEGERLRELKRLVNKLRHPDPRSRYQETREVEQDLSLLRRERARSGYLLPDCFLGRRKETASARTWIESKAHPFVLGIGGEAGSGKSALLRRVALEAETLGYRTVAVRCFPESRTPYQPLRTIAARLASGNPRSRAWNQRRRRLVAEGRSHPAGGETTMDRRRFLIEVTELLADATRAEPTLLVIDDAHLADSTTVDWLAHAVETSLASGKAAAGGHPQPPLILFSYRSEIPFRQKLGSLAGARPTKHDRIQLLELDPLPLEVVEEWIRSVPPERVSSPATIENPVRLRGSPLAIQLALGDALRPPGPGAPQRRATEISSFLKGWLAGIDGEAGQLLAALATLGRPASVELLADLAELSPARARHWCECLARDGCLRDEDGAWFFRHVSLHSWLLDSLDKSDRRQLHRRIAELLRARRCGSIEEIARHHLLSDKPTQNLESVLAAARHLSRTTETRGALDLYNSLLDLVGADEVDLREVVALEAAELQGRLGNFRRAAALLRSVARGVPSGERRGRIEGRIGALLHRAGNPRDAIAHLKRGLGMLQGAAAQEWGKERLRMLSELAEIAKNQNDFGAAESYGKRAMIELASRHRGAPDDEVTRLEMVLLETLAHLRLRQFQYGEARGLFEQSLALSSRLGATPEASLILNNLGILHIQENRFRDAISCYERAERISRPLGEHQTLANIQSNLAILYAKIGEPGAAEDALREAEAHADRCDSDRVRFLRLHSAGLVELTLGRSAAAIECLRLAIGLGKRLKDTFVTAFDQVYVGECYLLQGQHRLAKAAFRSALTLSGSSSEVVRSMVGAREALLLARAGRHRDSRARAAELGASTHPQPHVEFLDAWNQLFIAWAARLTKDFDRAETNLTAASDFFSRVGIPGGEIHTSLELAALDIQRGQPKSAHKRLSLVRARFGAGRGALKNPLLSARALAYEAWALLTQEERDPTDAAANLVEAESFLIGRPLKDVEALIVELRAVAANRHAPPQVAKHSASPASLPRERDGGRSDIERRTTSTIPEPQSPLIVGNSPAIQDVYRLIHKIGPTNHPVLITGETGTGKELVARGLVSESSRRDAAFISVNCAALPEEILEAELFGYRRGSFSGAAQDRPGLLLSAQSGTFLFDEIGEMPPRVQAKIVRVLDTSSVRPVGGEREAPIDVRFLFATSRDLRALSRQKEFRSDLLYRLGSVQIHLPPLRERAEDLPVLVNHFHASAPIGGSPLTLSPDAQALLASYHWPGNVRELRSVVTRLGLMAHTPITANDLRQALELDQPTTLFAASVLRSANLDQLHRHLEKEYLTLLHADRQGNLAAMADFLGITERALYKRFHLLGIKPGTLAKGTKQ